jgi:thymidylate synthase (FAD)
LKAELVDVMGDDLRVVNAARVSFDKESEWQKGKWEDLVGDIYDFEFLSDKDVKLINYLAKHGHWTPFSHPQVTIRETVPIFVARQRFKHMVGFTYNEVSRRYVDDTPTFFHPEEWRGKPVNVKQGSSDEVIRIIERPYLYSSYEQEPEIRYSDVEIKKAYEYLIKVAEDLYNDMINSGVAPEQARMVLPQSMYTSYYVTGSLAAWARAYKQRVDSHAQKEIQDLAKQWGEIIEPLFPVSWAALTV